MSKANGKIAYESNKADQTNTTAMKIVKSDDAGIIQPGGPIRVSSDSMQPNSA